VRIFIEPPSFEVLEARLRGRGTEDERSLAIRLANAKGELDQAAEYDVRIVNDTLEEALADLDAAIERYEQEG
jgi:guanylate kinase